MTRFKSILGFVVGFAARRGKRGLNPIAFPPDNSSLAPFLRERRLRFITLLVGVCFSLSAKAGPILTEVTETMMEAQATAAFFIGHTFGADNSATLHFVSNVDATNRAFSYATLPNQTYAGAGLTLTTSGAFDAISGKYVWTSSGQSGAQTWNSTGAIEWVGDPTGDLSVDNPGELIFGTVEYHELVILGNSTGIFVSTGAYNFFFTDSAKNYQATGIDLYDSDLGIWHHSTVSVPGTNPAVRKVFSAGFFASPAEGGAGGFEMIIRDVPEPSTLLLVAVAMLTMMIVGGGSTSCAHCNGKIGKDQNGTKLSGFGTISAAVRDLLHQVSRGG